MKVCMVGLEIGPSIEGSFVGGSVNNVVRLSKGLWENGHQIHIVTTPARYSQDAAYEVPWAQIHPLQAGGAYPSARHGFEFIIRAISEIRLLHKREKFEIIHGHSGYPPVGFVPSASGKIFGIPSVHTLYCSLEEKTIERKDFQFLQNTGLIRNLFLSVDRIVAISNHVKSSLEKIGLPEEIINVIPLAIDTSSFNPKVSGEHVRTALGMGSDEPLLLFVGNLTKTKGVYILIEAMKAITKDFPSAKLLITLHVSEDKLSEETRSVRAKIDSFNLTRNIKFMGITTRMPQVIAACDIFAAPFLSLAGPSDHPLPLLEAMAMAKPVVATRIGGIQEVVTNNRTGMLIRPKNPAQLAKAVVHLLENEDEAKRIGQNASVFVRKNFSAEKVVRMNENLYNEIA